MEQSVKRIALCIAGAIALHSSFVQSAGELTWLTTGTRKCWATSIKGFPNLVITSAGCANASSKLLLVSEDGRATDADIVASSQDYGLAVFSVGDPELTLYPLLSDISSLNSRSELWFPMFDETKVQKVAATLISVPNRKYSYLFSARTMAPVQSPGAPVFNDKDEIVGVITHELRKNESGELMPIVMGFSAPILSYVLEEASRTNSIRPPPRLGITAQDLTPELAKVFGLPGQNGSVVVRLLPNSAVALQGLRSMDIVVAVDKATIKDTNNFFELLSLRHSGDEVHLHVFREGKKIVVKLTLP